MLRAGLVKVIPTLSNTNLSGTGQCRVTGRVRAQYPLCAGCVRSATEEALLPVLLANLTNQEHWREHTQLATALVDLTVCICDAHPWAVEAVAGAHCLLTIH